ncbi:MAG: NAD(P)/FAD-dependent oxidoreductase [Gemmatimonadetes bacterium]|nr:NAD(P)/FAD-dependent oxidoreductase [Gemmatimonadota bacterium]
MTAPHAPDYLVIGAGATALAFVDSLTTHSAATVMIVDGHDAPGGHWNDAYPFVRLHQPSAYYGVDSVPLGRGLRDRAGLNAGMMELSSGAEVLAYFDHVMRQQLLPTGRVTYHPRTWAAVHPDGVVALTSQVTGAVTQVRPRTIVDGTLARTEVPATHPPRYPVASEVPCIPLNALPGRAAPAAFYTVVGSGKTGIDAVLWLLAHEVPADHIRWIMPRDAWMLDRANFQMDPASFPIVIGGMIAQLEAIATATSASDVFTRLEAAGQLVRLDPAIEPTAYKCCTVSQPELRALRTVRDVVRLGHVRAVTAQAVQLTAGVVPLRAGEIVVDCSSCAVVPPPPVPVFEDGRINLLMVRTCQPTFSGALIGLIAAVESDTAARNALAHPVVSPNRPIDWLRMWAGTIRNRVAWAQHPAVDAWLRATRLDPIAIMARTVGPDDGEQLALLRRLRDTMMQAGVRLPALLADAA